MSTQIDLKRLVDVAELQKLTDDLYAATDIPSAIITMTGEVLTESGWQRICTDFHRKHPEANAECNASHTALHEMIKGGERFAIYKCPMGLVDASSPIIVEGEHVATVFAGKIFTSPPSEEDERAFRETSRKYGFDEDEYINAYREIPILPEDRFKPILSFLSRLAKLITNI
ncbi:MAG: PocR ligand-binding domain-containing protein, partial [Desulfuromonadales bacterium]|nr:PocR ligand-binding domain-containing protein [Desulfuromonadales bacterium]